MMPNLCHFKQKPAQLAPVSPTVASLLGRGREPMHTDTIFMAPITGELHKSVTRDSRNQTARGIRPQ